MQYPADMPVLFSGQASALATYGDAIWSDICDHMRLDVWFRPHDLVGQLPAIAFLAPSTQLNYIRAVLHAVRLDHQARPDAYDGHEPLRTRGGRHVNAYAL